VNETLKIEFHSKKLTKYNVEGQIGVQCISKHHESDLLSKEKQEFYLNINQLNNITDIVVNPKYSKKIEEGNGIIVLKCVIPSNIFIEKDYLNNIVLLKYNLKSNINIIPMKYNFF
jgi:hypothetical protein